MPDGQGPPLEVSIPIRFSPDGRSWGEGIVTTLTTSTLVVLSATPPEVRSKVYFALGIGFEAPTFHGEGRVTSLASTEPGVEPMPGFGLRFEGAPSDLAAAIAKLERSYPGALAIENDGGVAWPVVSDALTPPRGPDEGLAVWADGRQLAGESAAESPGATAHNGNEPLPAYVALLVRLATPLATCDAASVVVTHRGRVLSPASGIPTSALAASLTALERVAATAPSAAPKSVAGPAPEGDWSLDLSDFDAPTMEIKSPAAIEDDDADEAPSVVEVLWDHPVVELVATQMRMVDTLALADWRYGRLTADLLASLDRDRTLLDGIQLRISTSADEAGLSEEATGEIAQSVADVGTFVTRLAWHAMAIESASNSASFYETFQIEKERLARQAAIAARAAAREAAEEPKAAAKAEPARKERDEPRKAESKPRKEPPKKEEKPKKAKPSRAASAPLVTGEWKKVPLWAIVLVVFSVLIAITRITNAARGRRDASAPPSQLDVASLRNDLIQVASKFQIRDAVVEGKTLKLLVDTTWLDRLPKERRADLEAISLPVIARSFADFVVVAPDGKQLATFHEGRYEVAGYQSTAPPPSKDAER